MVVVLAKAIRSFQDASKEFENEFKREAQQIEESIKMSAELEGKKSTPEKVVKEEENAPTPSEPG